MKIAYMTSQYPAPSHTFIRREVMELRRQGLEIHTFSVRPPNPVILSDPEHLESYKTTCYLQPISPVRYAMEHMRAFALSPRQYFSAFLLAVQHRTPGIKALVLSFAYFVEAMVFAMELRRRKITHVHNHFANPSAIVTYTATHYLRIPFSLTLHGNSETDYPAGLLLGEKIRKAAFAACVSYYGRAQAYRTIPSSHWDKLEIVRCGVDLSRLQVTPRSIEKRKLRFICVARLSDEKGHSGLLRAYAQACRSTQDSELVLVGDGPMRSVLEQEVKDLGISDHVVMLGALPEQATLQEIAKSDALVLASFIEGLPVALMEGMGHGLPVIAPHVAGIPEMIRNGENGLLFHPSDWRGLSLAIRYLLENEPLRNKLSINGRRTIEEDFEISHVVQPLIKKFRATHGKTTCQRLLEAAE